MTNLSVRELARQTPASRDRYVDFLRLASIVVVVLGHWLMLVVVWHGSAFHAGNVIGSVPGLWLATWLLQVMPVFFFVGGFANLATIDALRRKGQGSPEFIASRVARLLKPVLVLLAVWVPAIIAIEFSGLVDPHALRSATKLVCQPLWFIGVHLAVTALAPAMRELHARAPVPTAAALFAGAAVVDTARFGVALESVGYLNVLLVWLFAQQLGFFYADGALLRLRCSSLVAAAFGALGALVLLTTVGPYPHSMVGLPGDRISNMSPPTVCLAVLAVFQVALVMLCREAALRRLVGVRVWRTVVAGNGVIMTVFLWHLTAALLALVAWHVAGLPQPEGASALWWSTRPLWVACACVPLAGLVALFGRFERPRPARYVRGKRARLGVAAGITMLSITVLGIAGTNLPDLLADRRVDLALVALTPVELTAVGIIGLTLVRRSVRVTRVARTPV